MLKSPKQKGDRWERELAAYLNAHVFAGAERVRRAPLSGGGRTFSGNGDQDLIGLPGIWAEAKNVERLNIWEAMAQASSGVAAQKRSEAPVVFVKRNRVAPADSLVVMRLGDWVELLKSHLPSHPQSPPRSQERGGDVGVTQDWRDLVARRLGEHHETCASLLQGAPGRCDCGVENPHAQPA